MQNFDKLPEETQEEYFYRLCASKENDRLTWKEIADIMNDTFELSWGESKYRKEWYSLNRVASAAEDNKRETDEEILKLRRRLSDKNREYNKILTKEARSDNLLERLCEAANKVVLEDYSWIETTYKPSLGREALLLLSDWHYGQTSKNIWNEYNTDICKERISKLCKKTVEYLNENKIKKLHISLLGDMINGAIHVGCRVASEENTSDQLINVSEILANLINKLSIYVDEVCVYSTYGNHARTIQNKDDSIHADNMEKIIPWWLKERLRRNEKVKIIDSDYYEFNFFEVCGYNIVCTHGDLDKFKDLGSVVNNLFTKKFGKTIDYTFSGDKHHLEMFEQFNIESTLVGSMCGTDEFANNKRLYSNPFQTLCIFAPNDGKICTYNIKF